MICRRYNFLWSRLQVEIDRFADIAQRLFAGASLGPAAFQGRAMSREKSVFPSLNHDMQRHAANLSVHPRLVNSVPPCLPLPVATALSRRAPPPFPILFQLSAFQPSRPLTTFRFPCAKTELGFQLKAAKFLMSTVHELKQLALNLPEKQRAVLAAHLLSSLPPVLQDDDEGIAEALRRDAEMEADPPISISLEQLDQQIGRRGA